MPAVVVVVAAEVVVEAGYGRGGSTLAALVLEPVHVPIDGHAHAPVVLAP